ncbi:MAG: ExsB family protein [Gammaproteobacteria bacterium]|nr:ExsB family protein [Gammaproteobacteria bacterium]NIR60611.1 ExsB family protein [Gammaproteobacteria bacterium]
MPSRSVVSLSGGVDSTTLLHQEHREFAVEPLFIDYGQRAAAREHAAAEWQCRALGLTLSTLDISAAGEALGAEQDRRLHVPLPHRNLVLLGLTLSFAVRRSAGRLALAINRDDTDAYPSASADFIDRFRALAASLGEYTIATPLVDRGKTQVIQIGLALGVPFAHTYSCLLGRRAHCGLCPQCRARRKAFAEARASEPPGFYRRKERRVESK